MMWWFYQSFKQWKWNSHFWKRATSKKEPQLFQIEIYLVLNPGLVAWHDRQQQRLKIQRTSTQTQQQQLSAADGCVCVCCCSCCCSFNCRTLFSYKKKSRKVQRVSFDSYYIRSPITQCPPEDGFSNTFPCRCFAGIVTLSSPIGLRLIMWGGRRSSKNDKRAICTRKNLMKMYCF